MNIIISEILENKMEDSKKKKKNRRKRVGVQRGYNHIIKFSLQPIMNNFDDSVE